MAFTCQDNQEHDNVAYAISSQALVHYHELFLNLHQYEESRCFSDERTNSRFVTNIWDDLRLGVPEAKIWDRIQSLAAECPETDLDVCPTLFGERHNPRQRASVSNITAMNTTLGSVYSALCKGVIDNLHSMMSQDCLLAAGIHRIICSGTAITKNILLQEQIRQQYKLPLELSEGSQADAAVGAAFAMLDAVTL